MTPDLADNKNVAIRISKRPGTTLVELLVCLVFLGLCAGAMLNGIGAASRQASVAEEKLLALSIAKNELAKAQVAARDGTISARNTTTTPSGTGIKYPVTVQTVVAKVGGGTSRLYSVTTTVTWTSNTGPEHSGKIGLQTNVMSEQP